MLLLPQYPGFKVALAQMAVHPGEPYRNAQNLIAHIARARDAGATHVFTPEMSIPGPIDGNLLLQDRDLDNANTIHTASVIRASHGMTVGYGTMTMLQGRPVSTIFVAHDGRLLAKIHKTVGPDGLPPKGIVSLPLGSGVFLRSGLFFCDDLFSSPDPMGVVGHLLKDGAEVLIGFGSSQQGPGAPQGPLKLTHRQPGQPDREVPLILVDRPPVQGLGINLSLFVDAPSTHAYDVSAAHPFPIQPQHDIPRQRLRDLGIIIGHRPTGALNAITDVARVRVGHVTLSDGPVQTGVTAVLPHGGNIWSEKVPAAVHVLNGNGELTGAHLVNTQGALDVPIVFTGSRGVANVHAGVSDYMKGRHPEIGKSDDVVLAVVGECDDSDLNDYSVSHVSPEDARRAIENAKGGVVPEGCVGAGTGMITYGFKAGIGTASRVLSEKEGGWTVGVLVNTNMAAVSQSQRLIVKGVPVGEEIHEEHLKAKEGSIIVVIATDAPLDHLRLKRLAERATIGLIRTGSALRHGSGDLFIAFSTAHHVPHQPDALTSTVSVVSDHHINPLFEAVAEAVEEAILNALTQAHTTVGRDGNTAQALPLDQLQAIMRRYGRGPRQTQ